MSDTPYIHPDWEIILEEAKEKNKNGCRHMIRKETPTGSFLESRCGKKAKYVIKEKDKYKPEYPACPKHAVEAREKPDTTVRPLDPKLDIFM